MTCDRNSRKVEEILRIGRKARGRGEGGGVSECLPQNSSHRSEVLEHLRILWRSLKKVYYLRITSLI